MSKTFRIAFREWQQFDLFLPARSRHDAILIAETTRRCIGTVRPIVECDGGTDTLEASAAPALSSEALSDLEGVVPILEESARLNRNSQDARAVRLLRAALANAKGGAPC